MAILTAARNPTAAHWYTRAGQPAHEQPRAKGEGNRPTNLADARKLQLVPSVTTILKAIARPQLEAWKIRQAILAAANTPRQPAETADYWARRVEDAAFAQVAEAADLGSRIHGALDDALDGKPIPDDLRTYCTPVLAWASTTAIAITERETILTNPRHGYAGRADVLFAYGHRGLGILDYKTTKTKPGQAVEPRDGQAMQLAAYAAAKYGAPALPKTLAALIYISTTEPGRVEIIKVDRLAAHFTAFCHAAALWRHMTDYDSRWVPDEPSRGAAHE